MQSMCSDATWNNQAWLFSDTNNIDSYFTGVGFEHFGAQGQNIIRSVISIASENYPELMKKCYMINTPWVFNTIWYFIKVFISKVFNATFEFVFNSGYYIIFQGLIASRTINKVAILGSDFMGELEANIPSEFIPGDATVLSHWAIARKNKIPLATKCWQPTRF